MYSADDIKNHKGAPLVMVTAYDVCFAAIADEAAVDIILVGDSLANVVLGKARTSELKMETILPFVEAVAAGAKNTHIVADMPFHSYEDPQSALLNAQKFLQAGAHSVKLEGLKPDVISHLVENRVCVMGHLGLLPQTATSLKQVGKDAESAGLLLEQAKAMEKLGAYAMVLEHMDYRLGKNITESINIPTIGIGAGPHTSGQVLVMHDFLGLKKGRLPPFARKFAHLYEEALEGFKRFSSAVRQKSFPEMPG